jgi:hypothetical protein
MANTVNSTTHTKPDATEILKEIQATCKLINPSFISHKETGKGTFEIHIKAHLDNTSWNCVKEVIKNHKVAIKETYGDIIIYTPQDAE